MSIPPTISQTGEQLSKPSLTGNVSYIGCKDIVKSSNEKDGEKFSVGSIPLEKTTALTQAPAAQVRFDGPIKIDPARVPVFNGSGRSSRYQAQGNLSAPRTVYPSQGPLKSSVALVQARQQAWQPAGYVPPLRAKVRANGRDGTAPSNNVTSHYGRGYPPVSIRFENRISAGSVRRY